MFGQHADASMCWRLTEDAAEKLSDMMNANELWLQYCEPCDQEHPYPLHIEAVEFTRHDVDRSVWVKGIEYSHEDVAARRIPGWREFEYRAMLEAIEELGPPADRSVTIQGRAIDIAYLYRPVGNDRYRSVGVEFGCAETTEFLTYHQPDIDAEAPPPEAAWTDISEQCYDGCCVERDAGRATLTTTTQVTLLGRAEADAPEVATLGAHTKLKLLRLLSHVTPIEVTAVRDHDIFQRGDKFYLLNSLGEGFYRVWHYGGIHEVAMLGLSSDSDYPRGTDPSRCTPDKDGCWAEAEPHHDRERWWGEVATGDGIRGWLPDIHNTGAVVEGVTQCD
jgi:hypothetical protein